MKLHVKTSFFAAQLSTLLLILCLIIAAEAKLRSKPQNEKRMVTAAVRVSERWMPLIPTDYKTDEMSREAFNSYQKKFESYGNGIFKDMNISEDATWFYIYGHEKPEVLTALDQLDTAAFCLSVEDQERYFEAKYEIHHTLFEESKNRSDSLKLWMQRMAFDQESLLRINLNLKHTLNLLISDIEKYELTKSFPPESISNHFRRIAAVTYVLKVRKTRQHNHKAAIVLARNAVKDIKPEDNLCTDTWYSVSNSTCARCYDQILVKSLCGTLGGDGQLLMEEVCSRYWNNENITKLLLPRFTKPTSNAFDLFRKAGNTDELKNNRIIAWTEMTLWKKAHKFRKFKKEYPERYRLAIKK